MWKVRAVDSRERYCTVYPSIGVRDLGSESQTNTYESTDFLGSYEYFIEYDDVMSGMLRLVKASNARTRLLKVRGSTLMYSNIERVNKR